MRVAVLGAAGRTGRHVVDQALGRGHEVVAVTRGPAAGERGERGERLVRRQADALDATAVRRALSGADAVVSTLGGGTSRRPTTLYSAGTAHLLAAMRASGASRLAVVSAVPVGGPAGHPPLERLVLVPVLRWVLAETYADMARMEALLAGTGLAWSVLRPPRLVDRPGPGRYRLASAPLAGARSITCADLATALLDVLEAPVGIAYVAAPARRSPAAVTPATATGSSG